MEGNNVATIFCHFLLPIHTYPLPVPIICLIIASPQYCLKLSFLLLVIYFGLYFLSRGGDLEDQKLYVSNRNTSPGMCLYVYINPILLYVPESVTLQLSRYGETSVQKHIAQFGLNGLLEYI
jgi:hypothetical protein